jgi:lon-related putative ATP-dependent protease
MAVEPLKPEQLYNSCDPAQFDFDTTADLPELQEILGQPRAVEALRFGIGIRQRGYNIFALGPEGIGKHTIVERFFREQAQSEPSPSDWCYVNNFRQSFRPKVIQLTHGEGIKFSKDMDRLIEELSSVIPSAFQSDEYRARKQVIESEFKERQDQAFESIQKEARDRSLMVLRTPEGLIFAPERDGQVLPPEDFQKLTEAERQKIEEDIEALQTILQAALEELPDWQRELRSRLRDLNREILSFSVGRLVETLRQGYAGYPEILQFLDDVQFDVVENSRDFLDAAESDPEARSAGLDVLQVGSQSGRDERLRRYRVNLLVDHSQNSHAPVIYEDNPTYQKLIGRVEQTARLGALVTDFSLIKAGSLLQANGGYILIEARDLLNQPYAWEGLKRSLQSGQVKIETPGQMLNSITTISLEPEPIPLDVKVALIGDRLLYYLLAQYDPDFKELFKIEADFDEEMDRQTDILQDYAQLIGTIAHQNGLLPLSRTAVARVIEHSSRMVSDSQKLSASMDTLIDVVREAHHWAETAGDSTIQAEHIEKAINAQIYRSNRLQERMQEEILRETILIDTQGEKVGQINGLSVLQLGNTLFGKPSRISAQVRAGKGKVIDVEREVELGGPLHTKGVLILSSFLGARYAGNLPLSLNASLVFEQSYGGVDGDSASSAELYALLSAISSVPIQQSFAVTGSVNQHGEVQAIGGVNEKIEGFFDLCSARGLSGKQGVLIPASNVKHLMLSERVVEAVRSGEFTIYPIEHVDEGIEILTGLPVGNLGQDGIYPERTINRLAQDRLNRMSAHRNWADEDSEDME